MGLFDFFKQKSEIPEVKSSTSQSMFPELAEMNEDELRETVETTTDQDLLVYIVENYSDEYALWVAINKLDEKHQTLFAHVANNDETDYRKAGKAAVMKLTDQQLLAEIAINDNKVQYFSDSYDPGKRTTLYDYELGKLAVDKLTDRRLLADVARKAKNPNVREMALEKLD